MRFRHGAGLGGLLVLLIASAMAMAQAPGTAQPPAGPQVDGEWVIKLVSAVLGGGLAGGGVTHFIGRKALEECKELRDELARIRVRLDGTDDVAQAAEGECKEALRKALAAFDKIDAFVQAREAELRERGQLEERVRTIAKEVDVLRELKHAVKSDVLSPHFNRVENAIEEQAETLAKLPVEIAKALSAVMQTKER